MDTERPGISRTYHSPRLNNIHSLSNTPFPKLPRWRKMSPLSAPSPCSTERESGGDRFGLKERPDSEIIFNLCPFQAPATPVFLDGVVREGSAQPRFKAGNYCTNYSHRCRVITDIQVNARPAQHQMRPAHGCSNPSFPFQIFDLLRCLQSALGEQNNRQKLLIAGKHCSKTQALAIC